MRTRVYSIVLLALVVAAFATSSARFPKQQGRQATVVAAASHEGETSQELRRQAFDIVWKTVKDKHFDPNFGGVDWDAVRERYLPRLSDTRTDKEFYDLLQQLLGELHESHFAIYPPGTLPENDSGQPHTGTVGLDVRIIDEHAVVTRVKPDSPAARASIGTGFVLESIDGTPTGEIIERASRGSDTSGIKRIHQTRSLLAALNGEPGTSVQITFAGKPGTRDTVKIKRERLTGEVSPRMGNFPPQYVEFESGRVQGGISYLRFNVFVVSIMERLRAAVRSARDAKGIVIDLRGNPGGVGQMSCGLAGMLESDQTSLGTMRMRAGFQNFAVFPQSGAYLGPVVVLIDEMSASTSEIFAGGMQALGRAVVVGNRSAGAALPSFFERLPTGAVFQYAIGDFRTPKGLLIEGHGITPDLPVELRRDALLDGIDAQLNAAIKTIETIKTSPPAKRMHQ